MSEEMLGDETYLGDAVYASFDGYMIKLRTGDGNNQVIYLEPSVYAALENFASRFIATSDSHIVE
jgi:hypothetical protein